MPHLDLFHGLGAGATPRLAAAGPGACLRVASPLWASARVRHRLPSGSPLAGHPATQPLHPPTSPPRVHVAASACVQAPRGAARQGTGARRANGLVRPSAGQPHVAAATP